MILMVFPGMVEDLPPLLTAASCLATEGEQVMVAATGCGELTRAFLAEYGVEVTTCQRERIPAGKAAKAILAFSFVRLLRRTMARLNPDILWYHGRHGMRYAWWLRQTKPSLAVAHAHEMDSADSLDGRMQQAVLRRAGIVIVPEINRAWMMKLRSRSEAPFVVIPNRLPGRALPGADRGEARSAFLAAGGSEGCRQFVIYQGLIREDRCLAEALAGFRKLARPDWGFIVIGSSPGSPAKDRLEAQHRDDRRIVFLPRVQPPHHLEITRGCRLGILLYAPTELNNVYCAPNKVFEYAYFGLGMIFPDYPGLRSLGREFSLGEVCNPLDPESVAGALGRAMETPRERYHEACRRFLSEVPDPSQAYARVAEVLRIWRSRNGGEAASPRTIVGAPVLDLSRGGEVRLFV